MEFVDAMTVFYNTCNVNFLYGRACSDCIIKPVANRLHCEDCLEALIKHPKEIEKILIEIDKTQETTKG